MVCINNCSTWRTSAPPIVTSAPDIMWGTDGVRVFTADDGWVWTFAAVDHWHAECVGWHPAARGGARAAPARASPATPASGQPGCRRGSAAARGSCDGPHPGTVSGPGQCEWPPATAHPTVRASARGAPGPHPALGAAHEPAARSAPSATVPTGSTPVVFFNEKRTYNEERSTQRNRPLNRIMASPAAGGASCGRGVVPAAARSGTPAPVQRPYWRHRREHLNRRVKKEAVEGAVEWYRSLLMVHMVFNGHSRKYGIWNDLWHRWSRMVCTNICSTLGRARHLDACRSRDATASRSGDARTRRGSGRNGGAAGGVRRRQTRS